MRRRTLLKAGAGALPLAAFVSTTASGRESTQESFEPLDSLELDEGTEVYVEGDAAFVAAGDGLVVVDVSDPENISVLAEQRNLSIGGEEIQRAWDLWYSNDRLALIAPVQGVPSGTGFILFDVSDPSSPEIVTEFDTGYNTHNCCLADGMLYLTGNGLVREEDGRIPLVTYDVRSDEPEEVSRWSPRDYDQQWQTDVPLLQRVLHDVHVQDGIAYLSYWDAGTWILDVSDPANPEVLSRVGDYSLSDLSEIEPRSQESDDEFTTPEGNAHHTMVNDDASLMAVGAEAWSVGGDQNNLRTDGTSGGPGGIRLYDISDKTDPQQLSTIEAPETFNSTRPGWFTTAHNSHFAGDRLYTSWYYGGVKIYDVSDPENPEELAWWRKPREANMWSAYPGEPDEFFVATSYSQGAAEELRTQTPGLYTFPDRAGQQPDPPDLTTPPADLLGSENGNGNGAEEGNGNGGEDGNGNDSESGSNGESTENGGEDMENGDENGEMENGGENGTSQSTSPTDQESDDGSGPGFGVGGAITAIGGGSYLLARRAGLVDDDDA